MPQLDTEPVRQFLVEALTDGDLFLEEHARVTSHYLRERYYVTNNGETIAYAIELDNQPDKV